MTYGEYWIAIKDSLQMVDGKWTFLKPLQNMPRQMSRQEASLYYNKKLSIYWRSSRTRSA